jgi:hypothetical protein
MRNRTTLAAFVACTVAAAMAIPAFAQDPVPHLVNYQGRLTDGSGNPLSNGAYQVLFQLYDTPSAATNLIWGATNTVAVVGGQFNVVLGSAGGSSVGNAAVSDIGYAFGAQNRYLQLTILTDSTGTNFLATAQVLAPRQQILTSPYAFTASYAATALITNGQIQAANIANGSIGAAQIASNSIPPNLLALRPVGTNVPVGGVAISASSGAFVSPTPTSNTPIPNFNLSIATAGNPVEISFASDGSGNDSRFEGGEAYTGFLYLYLYRNGVQVASEFFHPYAVLPGNQVSYTQMYLPPGVFRFVDYPPAAGTYNYSVQILFSASGVNVATANAYWMRMIAREY